MIKRKKTFRHTLNYKKAELVGGKAHLGASGISMPMLKDSELEEYRKQFSRQKNSMNFGMLGNDPKYYNSASLGDITPKPEDFVEVPFRLISATIVGGGTWKATDFSDAKILKKSTQLLDGVPLYKDHETDLDNWVGLVNGVKWTKSFTDKDGVVVPAGIDGIVAIDKVTNPKVARGVLAGAIYSNSVTVEFDWEMSHDFENEWDFLNKIGQLGADGKMVRRMVKGIHNYHESSLVWLGADPFAKAIDADGNHKKIDVSSVYSYKKAEYQKQHKIDTTVEDTIPDTVEEARTLTVNFAVNEKVLSLAKRSQTSLQKNKNMNEFLVAFIAAFGDKLGLKKDDKLTKKQFSKLLEQLSVVDEEAAKLTKANLAAFDAVQGQVLDFHKTIEGNEDAETVDITAFMKDHTFVGSERLAKLEKKATKVKSLKSDKKGLESKVIELADKAAIGSKFIELKRKEAVRLYKLSAGDAADKKVISLFKKANEDEVEGLLKQYTKDATHKFSGSCKDCGSEKFEFRSSLANTEDPTQDDSIEVSSAEKIWADRAQGSMSIGRTKEDKK